MEPKALHILEQAARLYHRYGVKSVTMDDIARHLGISKKTLYEHFRDKEDLVERVLRYEYETDCVYLNEISGQNLNALEELFAVYRHIHATLRDYNPSMGYDIRKYYPALYGKMQEARRKRMYQSVHANLAKGKKEGLYRKELNVDIIARLHVARTETILDSGIFSQEELTSAKVFHELFLYHVYGILSPEGRTLFESNFPRLSLMAG